MRYSEFWITDHTDNSGFTVETKPNPKSFGAVNYHHVVSMECVEELKAELARAHQHILWLQDGWNEIRNFLSEVKHEPETEEMDEEIDLSDLDDQKALELRDYTEEFAMTYFREWYEKINQVQDLKHLDDYEGFKLKEIP